MPSFDPDRTPPDPLTLFRDWILDAADREVQAPYAFTLASLTEDGAPDARILILRDISEDGWRFASSRTSAKGRQLSADERACAVFHWPEVGRQIRARGRVRMSGEAAARREFGRRSVVSKAEAIGGGLRRHAQSERLSDPKHLEQALGTARAHVERDPSYVPEFWAVYELVPDAVEFWQADRDRAHIRLLFSRTSAGWQLERLWP